MIDWKRLFSEMSVDWRDRGPNTSSKDINICCPFCGDDYGYHLGISLSHGAYYCFREPTHGGRSLSRLLQALGATNEEAKRLIVDYGDGTQITEKVSASPAPLGARWRRFIRLEEADDCDAYYAFLSRKYKMDNCEDVADQFDLRCDEQGKWATRVLLPIREERQIVSWTGRTIREGLVPKYLMQSVVYPGLVYAPRVSTDITVIVEGPMDALKIAGAGMKHVGAVALLGKALNARKLLSLRTLLSNTRKIVFAPDADVDVIGASRMEHILALVKSSSSLKIATIRPPNGYKDAGEMPYSVIRPWVNSVT